MSEMKECPLCGPLLKMPVCNCGALQWKSANCRCVLIDVGSVFHKTDCEILRLEVLNERQRIEIDRLGGRIVQLAIDATRLEAIEGVSALDCNWVGCECQKILKGGE